MSAFASMLKCRLKPTTAADVFGLHGEHGEQITVRMIARGRAPAAIAGCAVIGAVCNAPVGSAPPALPWLQAGDIGRRGYIDLHVLRSQAIQWLRRDAISFKGKTKPR
jgi:hypothetical protein